MSLFSNTMYQVCSYQTNVCILLFNGAHTKLLSCTNVRVLDQGNVTRANVADVYVEINSNASRLIFRENVTENTLWSGTISYKELLHVIQWYCHSLHNKI